MIELRWGAATDPGARPHDQRGRHAGRSPTLFAVADGMGGHAGGRGGQRDRAADARGATSGQQPTTVASVTDVVRAANEAVYRRSLDEPNVRGMGTTLTLMAPAVGEDGRDRPRRRERRRQPGLPAGRGPAAPAHPGPQLRRGAAAPPGRSRPRRRGGTPTATSSPAPWASSASWRSTPGSSRRSPATASCCARDGLVNEVTDEDIARIITAAPTPQAAADSPRRRGQRGRRPRQHHRRRRRGRGGAGASTPSRTISPPPRRSSAWRPRGPRWLAPPRPGSTASTHRPRTRPPSPSRTQPSPKLPTAPTGEAAARDRQGRHLRHARGGGVRRRHRSHGARLGRTGYYVGYTNEAVVVFQGRPGGVLWFRPDGRVRQHDQPGRSHPGVPDPDRAESHLLLQRCCTALHRPIGRG